MGRGRGWSIVSWLGGALLMLVGCLPVQHQASPSQEGSSANYLGMQVCVSCHQEESSQWNHTLHARVFLLNPRNQLQQRGCEACHGPGSDHLADTANKNKIIAYTRQSGISVTKQNAMCMQCHQGQNRFYWDGSAHQINDVACSDCHNPMSNFSNAGLLRAESVSKTCFICHQQQRAEFSRRSHKPLLEGKVACNDCHNPHGSVTHPLLKGDSVNHLCYQCHAEKRGPFIWEHAPVRESCLNCHLPHGSNHEKLLVTSRPFLCQQCHSNPGHPSELISKANLAGGISPDSRAMNRSCQNCHAQIHGSNHPSGVRFHR